MNAGRPEQIRGELRKPELVGDTATDYDPTGHFVVLCEGDFDQQPVPEAQLHSAAVAFAWAAQTFHLASGTLASHRDVTPVTTCPGANLYAHVVSGELKRRVDELMSAGRVDLQTHLRFGGGCGRGGYRSRTLTRWNTERVPLRPRADLSQ